MSMLLRVISLFMLVFIFNVPFAEISHAATANQPISGVVLMSPTVQLFGYVNIVDGYAISSVIGCYAVIELRDTPGKTVVVRLSDQRLQSLLETALTTGNLVSFVGRSVAISPTPRGGSWNMDVYNVDEVTLYKTRDYK